MFSNSSLKNKPINNENTKIKINIADNFLLIVEIPMKNNSFYKHEKSKYQFYLNFWRELQICSLTYKQLFI